MIHIDIQRLDSSRKRDAKIRLELSCGHSPANVTADDHVAPGDILVDRVRDDTGGHRELHRARVHDADHVAGSGGLEDAEEWPVASILRVELNDLFLLSNVHSTHGRRGKFTSI